MRFFDLHCDTALMLMDGRPLYQNDGMLSIQNMRLGGVSCQFFAMFIYMKEFATPGDGYTHMQKMYRNFMSELELNQNDIALAKSAKDVPCLLAADKAAAILSLEEGGVLDNKLSRLDELYDMGVRLITLTWNYENCLGFPNSADPDVMRMGLKPFGLEAVRQMQELGIIVDVSHLSDGGFWDVAEIAKRGKKPFVASHSNARAQCGHPRNLTDNMLKALAEAGGVAGLNFYHKFLGNDETGSISQMISHLKHIRNVAGIDVPALGSDFDGFDGPCELSDCSQFPILAGALSKAGFSEEDIEKICWKNAMRMLEDIL